MGLDADIIVIGGGTFGAAAALAASRAGRRVIVLDRFNPPHTGGEHHGERRMFRTAYYEHADYVPLLRRAFAGWKQLEQESGESIFAVTGAVYAGPAGGEVVPNSRRAAAEHSIPHRHLSRDDLLKMWPGAAVPMNTIGLAEEPAGFLRCEAAVAAMLRLAVARGAVLRSSEAVESWHADPGQVEVRTKRRRLAAGALVITGGPGSGSLLSGLDLGLTVTRQIQAWATTPAAAMMRRCWAVERPDGALLYGFPFDPASGEMKFGIHARGPTIDPESLSPDVTFDELDDLRGALGQYFPELEPFDLRATACRYTNSPDSHFFIDRHPQHPNVVFGAGFSGHGFKFAPVIGEVLKELAADPSAPHPAPFLGLARLRSKP